MRFLTAPLVLGVAVAAARPDDTGAKADLVKLEGTWQVTAFDFGGKKLEPGKDGPDAVTFKGGKMTLAVKGKEIMAADVTVDPSKKPKAIDFTRVKDGKAETLPGIYELTGDELKVVMPGVPADRKAGEGLARPEGFDVKDKPFLVLTARRAEK